jgi:hypothetical protein
MKKSALFLAPTIALTLLFYLLAYFYLPPPPPSGSMMALFAGVAAVLVWLWQIGFRKARSRRKTGRVSLLLFSIALQLGLASCHQAQASTRSTLCKFEKGPRAGTIQDYASLAPLTVGSPCQDGAGSSGVIISAYNQDNAGDASVIADPQRAWPDRPTPTSRPAGPAKPSGTMPRVTGTALLVHKQTEESGYGLYSYALLTHAPEKGELPRYQAFFKALIELPSASAIADYLPKSRINITYLLLNSLPSDWKTESNSAQVDYVISHYDYARCAAMLASLPKHTGTGPVIASSLVPMSLDQHPRPVLVQDLSTAQPVLMADYVSRFVSQVAQDHFWEPNTLAAFALSLRNLLETAATGLGMSQVAVKSWVTYFK